MIQLLKHTSWQVRAGAAENLGKLLKNASRSGSGEAKSPETKPIYAALTAALDDADSFVVAKAIEALERYHDASLVEPLARVVATHPPLAAQAVGALAAGGASTSDRAVPHLRKFLTHANPAIRAAAIGGLCTLEPDGIDKDVAAALADAEGTVRAAGAAGMLAIMEGLRPGEEELVEPSDDDDRPAMSGRFKQPERSVTSRLWDLLLPSPAGKSKQKSPSKQPDDHELAPPSRPPAVERTVRQPVEAPGAGGQKPGKEEPGAPKPLTAKKSVEKPPEHPLDQWLVDFRAGRAKRNSRPAWMAQTIGPLRKMLAAPLCAERIAAALSLVPLGHQDEALAVLLAAVKSRPATVSEVDESLRWLPWPERLSWFDQLVALGPPDSLEELVGTLYRVSDTRAAPRLWQLLDDVKVTAESAATLRYALQSVYGGRHRYYSGEDSDAKQRKIDQQIVKEAMPFVAQGPRWKRVVALSLISQSSPDEAARLAAGIFADAKAEMQLRRDAFRFLLIAGDKADARRAATAAIGSPDPQVRRAALTFLAAGAEPLSYITEDYHVEIPREHSMASEEGAIPPKPTDLDLKALRGLAAGSDPEVAALAVYLLAISEEQVDLGLLASYWRGHRQQGPCAHAARAGDRPGGRRRLAADAERNLRRPRGERRAGVLLGHSHHDRPGAGQVPPEDPGGGGDGGAAIERVGPNIGARARTRSRARARRFDEHRTSNVQHRTSNE